MSIRKLQPNETFYFFTSIGNFTGKSAASFEDFAKGIREVGTESLEFHLQRGDFERWIVDIFRDETLATEIAKLRNQKLAGQALRKNLYTIVSNRYRELTTGLQKK